MKERYPDLPGEVESDDWYVGVKNETVFYGIAVNDISGFPTIDFRLSGILFHLPPEQYFIPLEIAVGEYTIGIRKWDQVCVGERIEE